MNPEIPNYCPYPQAPKLNSYLQAPNYYPSRSILNPPSYLNFGNEGIPQPALPSNFPFSKTHDNQEFIATQLTGDVVSLSGLGNKRTYENEIQSFNKISKISEEHSLSAHAGPEKWDSIDLTGININVNQKNQSRMYRSNGTLRYEGELLNGKPNGQGKAYYPDGTTIKYEGAILNNIPHGQGKEYLRDGLLSYEGAFLNGIPNGKGKQYRVDGTLCYEGDFLNGLASGKGKAYHPDGTTIRYEGNILNSKSYGQGKEYRPDGTLCYEGACMNGIGHGQGKIYHPDGLTLLYEGSIMNGLLHGQGKQYLPNGTLFYEGVFENGKPTFKRIAAS